MLLKQLFRRAFYVFSALLCWQAPLANAQQEAPAAAQAPCTAAVRVFEETICREDITMEEAHINAIKQQYEDEGLDSDQALRARSLERLGDIIWERALARKFSPELLAPQQSEVAAYRQTFKDQLNRGHEANVQTAAKVKALLAEKEHSQQDELKLRNLLQTLETSIAFYEERQSYNEGMPPEFHEMVIEAEEEMARTAIREWKINKALYEEYGGRVVLSQNSAVPVDAYGRFLDYIRNEGKLAVLDPEFRDVFADRQRFIKAAHEAVPESENPFAAPVWTQPGGMPLPQN